MSSSIEVSAPSSPVVTAGDLPAETHADDSTRERFEFSPLWSFRFDPHDRGLREIWYDPDASKHWASIPVPGTWDLDFVGGYNKQTIGWYAVTFDLTERQPETIYKLHFDGIFREGTVWLNGVEIGTHKIPYLPFNFDITEFLDFGGVNTLTVRIDDRIRRHTLPCSNIFTGRKHGWFPYGGIIRPVYIELTRPLYVAQVLIDTTLNGEVSAEIFLEHLSLHHSSSSEAPYQLTAWITDGQDILHAWPATQIRPERSTVNLRTALSAIDHWSPDTPDHRYRLYVELTSPTGRAHRVGYDFAFRRFEARDKRFFLNGNDCFLRGINRHEDHPEAGPIFQEDIIAEEIDLIDELDANFVRSGHYPNDVRVLKALEEAGMMIVEEIPVYQLDSLQLASERLRRYAAEALEGMIIRDYNRPGVVMWSIANEIHSWFPVATRFVRRLYDRVKQLDPDRPVMMARVTWPFPGTILDRFDYACGVVDVVGINQYLGWYFGDTYEAKDRIESIHDLHPEKTWFISEYGAGALRGRHTPDPPTEEPRRHHSYSEEFQAFYHREHLTQFDELPFIRGVMPWVLSDFRMEWTPSTGDPHPVRLTNLKGLTNDRRAPKEAFRVVRDFYSRRASS